ncbi:MAG: polysaccharide biosynthesis protein [Clostridia bacterium]|nr:polysaccharide biosynthesis protein [Clostridia bacterium]
MIKKHFTRRRNADGFMSGVLVLSLSTVIVKVIGLAYKIPMIAYLGAEGMGYFNSAYEIYAMLCVMATAGLPVALSLLISANRERGMGETVRRIDRSATAIFLLFGLIGTLFLLFFAKPMARVIGNEQAFFCILAIAPAMFFVCLSSSIRGYFQGFHQMLPTAISQLIEALGKLIFGIWFASIALKRGRELPVVAAFAILGLSFGTLLSALYLLIRKKISKNLLRIETRKEEYPPSRDGLSALFRIAIPMTLASAILSLTRLVDMAWIMRRLQDIGRSVSEANEIYGAYTTLAVPVFSLIPSLIAPISMALIPQLSAAIERKNKDEQAALSDRAFRLTSLLAMPASMGIAVYSKPILGILFSKETEAITIAAPLLSVLGFSILFSGLITTTNAVLQSYRQSGKPMISMSVGAVIKIVTAYVLIGHPSIGIYGAPISTLLCDLTVTLINLSFLGRVIPKSHRSEGVWRVYYKPMIASFLAILASVAVYLPIRSFSYGTTVAFFVALLVVGIVYTVLAVLFRIVTAEDIAPLPMGEKLLSFWRLYHTEKRKGNTEL